MGSMSKSLLILLNQSIGVFLYNIETNLKASLLFFLKEGHGFEKRMELGPLIKTIKCVSPQIGGQLENLIDKKLRNALAHGSIWFEAGGKVFLAKDSHLERVEELGIDEFLTRTKIQNIRSMAFTEVLMEKAHAGYFLG